MKRLYIILLGAVLLSGCGRSQASSEPPPIIWGEDVCTRCNMVVDAPRFAAAARLDAQGKPAQFDDIGDAFIFQTDARWTVESRLWVKDYDTEKWLEAPDAQYVMAPGLDTPMGHGVIAVAERHRAEALASRYKGRIGTYEQARAQVQATAQTSLQPRRETPAASPD